MKQLKISFYMAAMAIAITISSCSSNKTAETDQEVKAMDSVSTDLEASNKELDAQTDKVEASLEKVDKEIKTTK